MFAMINEITEKEAKVIVDFYHKIYPGIGKWYDRIQSHLGQNRTLYNLFGRPCRFLDRWGPDLFKPAYSYIPQSTVGELVNRGLIRIYNDHRPEMSSVELLQQIHDSIRGQIAYKNPQIMARALINIYKHLDPELETGGRTFKIKNDLKIGFNGANLKPIPVLYNENDQADALRDALHELKATK
jgi:DNA polymerase I-like protein with 3'-5' exonuclease and polymerase domains